MRELSLNVLDIAQNSVSANASLIQIEVNENTSDDTLTIIITDNGKGCLLYTSLLSHFLNIHKRLYLLLI